MKKYLSLLYNSALLIIIFVIVIVLLDVNNKVNLLATKNDLPRADNKAEYMQKSPLPNKKTSVANRELSILDGAFLPTGFSINANQKTAIAIINNGESSHSFVIDELNINSGLIEPGQTKEIVIDRQFTESKNYVFYSNAAGDDPQTFKGILMVTK